MQITLQRQHYKMKTQQSCIVRKLGHKLDTLSNTTTNSKIIYHWQSHRDMQQLEIILDTLLCDGQRAVHVT